MKNKKGFTLIEMLVVVLIIGILAAIAVPQYRKAVDKSRYSELMFVVKHIKNEQELFFLKNGRYADSCKELGTEAPSGTYLSGSHFYFNGNGNQWIDCSHDHTGNNRVAGITTRFGGVVSYEQCLDEDGCGGCLYFYATKTAGKRGRDIVDQYCSGKATDKTIDDGYNHDHYSCVLNCPPEAL